MAVEAIAAEHAAEQVKLAKRAAAQLARLWRQVDPASIAGSWRAQLPQAFAIVAGSQAAAAGAAGDYVDQVAAEYGAATAGAHVQPAAFAGVASDGRDLASLLYEPAVNALVHIKQGVAPGRALASGGFVLDMVARTQIADAGRTADGVAIAAHPQLTGYVRMIVGKTCSRCVILAGRRYRWNAGFKRHPRCDCRHVPVAEDIPDDVATDPKAYFRSLSAAEQDRAFTKAGAQAIRDGADMGKVVNARRGIQTSGGRLFTTESAGRRARLMPEQIYIEAKGDRAEALRLLERHGYVRRTAPRLPAVAPRPAPMAVPVRTFDERLAAAATEQDALASATFGLDRRPRPEAFTPEMARAVNTYTGSEYAAINNHLRGKPLPYGYTAAEVAPVIARLDHAMTASRIGRDVTTYRGVLDASGMFGDRLAGDLTGMQWREDAYLSTSAKQRNAAGFAGSRSRAPMVMRILAPAGTPAIEASGMDLEAELLFKRGLKLRVVADRGLSPDGVRHIDVEVLGD